jgi:hypothetical protein
MKAQNLTGIPSTRSIWTNLKWHLLISKIDAEGTVHEGEQMISNARSAGDWLRSFTCDRQDRGERQPRMTAVDSGQYVLYLFPS